MGHSHAIYNPSDHPVEFMNSPQDLEFMILGIATQKGALETIVGAGGRRGR